LKDTTIDMPYMEVEEAKAGKDRQMSNMSEPDSLEMAYLGGDLATPKNPPYIAEDHLKKKKLDVEEYGDGTYRR